MVNEEELINMIMKLAYSEGMPTEKKKKKHLLLK